ncbi:hypothetical protein GFK82_00156 [Candidatus Steffania adelgidicola]|nr:hypothetical protein GFK82_00156 [Candidatus Steffania adelgidicola]
MFIYYSNYFRYVYLSLKMITDTIDLDRFKSHLDTLMQRTLGFFKIFHAYSKYILNHHPHSGG